MAMKLASFLSVLVSFLVVLAVSRVERSEAAIYVVGDATGWTVPVNNDFYDDWNDNKDFRVGDQLVFNWTGVQNVVQVTELEYDSCTKVTTNVLTTSPVTVNLTVPGDHYFICTIGDQCLRGQKLEIEVKPALMTPPATSSPPPPSGAATTEGRTYVVGDTTGWTVPVNDDFYDDWNDNKDFRVGDKLVFNWTGVQNVVEVTELEYDNCANVTRNVFTTSPTTVTLTTVGDHYFISTIGNQCLRGQKLEIEVKPALMTPPTSSPPPPSRVERPEGRTYVVGDMTGWTVPINDDFYDDWNDNKDFRVGDKLVFNWTSVQNVVEVTELEYDNCANVTRNVFTTSPTTVNLTTIGDHYFICTIGNQCLRGQKLEIEVKPALMTPPGSSPPPPTTSASSPSQSPSTSQTSQAPSKSPTSQTPSGSTQSPTTPSTNAASPMSDNAAAQPSPSSSASLGPAVALSATFSALVFLL